MEEESLCTCENCLQDFDENNGIMIDEDFYCDECADRIFDTCIECGRMILGEDNVGDSDCFLCQSCYDSHYTYCDECEAFIRIDSAHYSDDDEFGESPLCLSCYERTRSGCPIHDYSYKPSPIFYGSESRYFGVELEMDEGGKSKENARELLGIANKGVEHIYIKSDGSLNDGFEIVTHPMTLYYHLNKMKWRELLRKSQELGYYSHQTDTAGLHVHVNRNSLGETAEKQEDTISRILHFVEMFWNELLIFSRRKEGELKRWADRYGRKGNPKETYESAKLAYSARYRSVNLTNRSTIEFRIFKGTLKYSTLAATLQMVNEICNVALFYSDKDLNKMTWSGFVASLDENKLPELVGYLKGRGLYENSEGVEV